MNRILKLADILRSMNLDEEAEAVEDIAMVDWEKELGQQPLRSETPQTYKGEEGMMPTVEYEEDYFDFDFTELSDLANFANRHKNLKKIGPYKLLGWGSFRRVFEVPGRYDYVIKIASDNLGPAMNKAEFALQQDFGGLFPQVFKHGSSDIFKTDYDWMLIERVNKMKGDEELNSFFPYLHNLINIENQGNLNNVYDFFWDAHQYRNGKEPFKKYRFAMSKMMKYALRREPLFAALIDL